MSPFSAPPFASATATCFPSGDGTNQPIEVPPVESIAAGSTSTLSLVSASSDVSTTKYGCCFGGRRSSAKIFPWLAVTPSHERRRISHQRSNTRRDRCVLRITIQNSTRQGVLGVRPRGDVRVFRILEPAIVVTDLQRPVAVRDGFFGRCWIRRFLRSGRDRDERLRTIQNGLRRRHRRGSSPPQAKSERATTQPKTPAEMRAEIMTSRLLRLRSANKHLFY